MTASIISLRWKHWRLKTCRHLSHRQARHPKDRNRLLWPFARFQKYGNDAYVLLPAKLRSKRANHPSNRFCSTAVQRPDAARYRWNNFFNRVSRSPNIFSSALPILLSISCRSSCLRLVSRSISSILIFSATITRFSDDIYVSNTLSPPKSFPRRRSDGRLPHPNSTLSSPYHTD